MNRHEQRKKAFQIIFQLDTVHELTDDVKFSELYREMPYIKSLVNYYTENHEEIDASISRYLHQFTIDRISKVERALLRLAISELSLGESPRKVVINEIVILAKSYGDNESYKFINGVLKSLLQSDRFKE